MEFCESGDLRRELNSPKSCRGLGQSQVLEILNDIVSALGYLHNRRIIHRDLKPENIVMKKTETRLIYKLIGETSGRQCATMQCATMQCKAI